MGSVGSAAQVGCAGAGSRSVRRADGEFNVASERLVRAGGRGAGVAGGRQASAAAELDGARDALRALLGARLPPLHPAAYTRTLATVRASLTPAALDAARARPPTRRRSRSSRQPQATRTRRRRSQPGSDPRQNRRICVWRHRATNTTLAAPIRHRSDFLPEEWEKLRGNGQENTPAYPTVSKYPGRCISMRRGRRPIFGTSGLSWIVAPGRVCGRPRRRLPALAAYAVLGAGARLKFPGASRRCAGRTATASPPGSGPRCLPRW